jgi:hypothetical protein
MRHEPYAELATAFDTAAELYAPARAGSDDGAVSRSVRPGTR